MEPARRDGNVDSLSLSNAPVDDAGYYCTAFTVLQGRRDAALLSYTNPIQCRLFTNKPMT